MSVQENLGLEARIAALEATIANRPMRQPARRRVRRAAIAAVVLALGVVAPAIVLASHDFSDVPTTSTFHTTISNIKRAGLTSGCGAGKYCPADPVRRDAMSAFLNRGLGRGASQGFGEDDITALTNVASVTLATPGAGWILVQADATAINSATTGCPCDITIEIKGPGLSNSLTLAQRLENSPSAEERTSAHLGTHHLFAVPAAGNHTFRLWMQRFTGSATVLGAGEISAIWIPFGDHGEAYFGDTPQ